jgi:hypothetical protein
MFNRRNLMQTAAALALPAAAGLGLPAWAKGGESPLPKVGSTLQLPPVALLDGSAWKPAAGPERRLWCTGGPAGALFAPYSRPI